MFETLCCIIHREPAKLEEAHLDITQIAKPYNKEEYMYSHGMSVYNVQWCMFYEYVYSSFRIETPSGHGLQLVSG